MTLPFFTLESAILVDVSMAHHVSLARECSSAFWTTEIIIKLVLE
jgi:hypothetical protein